jgi:hypothetical protein
MCRESETRAGSHFAACGRRQPVLRSGVQATSHASHAETRASYSYFAVAAAGASGAFAAAALKSPAFTIENFAGTT